MVPAEQNEQLRYFYVLVTFLFVAHAGSRFGAQMDSKRFRKTSGNSQDTSKKDCGFRVDASLAISATFSFDADSEIAPRTIYCFLCIGPTTGLCSLLSQRNPGPSPRTPYDWNYVYYMWQIPHHTPKTPRCSETLLCARIATGWNVGRTHA